MKKPVLIVSDGVYSLPSSKVSLVNLIKHNIDDMSKYTFRSIVSTSIDDMCNRVSKSLFEFKNLTKNNKGTVYILCGLKECNGGYNVPIFSTLVSSIGIELDNINYDVVFIRSVIDHGLPGKIGGWYKRSDSVIKEVIDKYFFEEINPVISVKVIDDDVVLPIESSRIIVKSICDDITQKYKR